MSTTPERLEALRRFAAHWLADDLVKPERASADASFRSYWRVASRGRSFVVMDAPPGKEDLGPWLDVDRRLRAALLHAPEVLASDTTQGFVLMSDLGTRTYLPELTEASVDKLYGDAFDALLAMQTRVDATGLPGYDEPRLMAELELFPEWFLKRHLGVVPECEEWDIVEGAFRALINSALEQPRRFVHRDYHSRNLMIVEGRNPGIIDFQDAVLGPVTYDLVSLLRDCYIAWPAERVQPWSNRHRDRLVDAGVLNYGELRWKRWFDWMGLQRHLKVLGIFCRLWYRDGKRAYLDDLPLVLKYTLDVAGRYKELAPFAAWLRSKVGDRDVRQPAATASDQAAPLVGAASAATGIASSEAASQRAHPLPDRSPLEGERK